MSVLKRLLTMNSGFAFLLNDPNLKQKNSAKKSEIAPNESEAHLLEHSPESIRISRELKYYEAELRFYEATNNFCGVLR
jgi:hypothetical protein